MNKVEHVTLVWDAIECQAQIRLICLYLFFSLWSNGTHQCFSLHLWCITAAPQAINRTTVEKNASRVGEVYTYGLDFQCVWFLKVKVRANEFNCAPSSDTRELINWVKLCGASRARTSTVWTVLHAAPPIFQQFENASELYFPMTTMGKKVNVWNSTSEYLSYNIYYFI